MSTRPLFSDMSSLSREFEKMPTDMRRDGDKEINYRDGKARFAENLCRRYNAIYISTDHRRQALISIQCELIRSHADGYRSISRPHVVPVIVQTNTVKLILKIARYQVSLFLFLSFTIFKYIISCISF